MTREDVLSFWRRSRRVERVCYVAGALLLASGLIHLAILVISGGSWQGPLSLRKPTTFGLSFGLTLITIVWAASFLRLSERIRAALLGAFTIASVLETVLVSLQAWRGVPSHFNMETTFDAAVARALAAGGITLVAIIVALMIAKGMQLVFAGDPQAAYATGGAFKPMHAVTMHAVLILPLLAWLLSFANWSERRRLRVVLLAAAGYLVVAAVVAIENFVGL